MLAILDYDAGNIESVRLALRHVGGEPVFVRDAAAAKGAERIVFPGVGSAGQCMRNLCERGFDRLLGEAAERGTPVLAICVGMQLLFDFSEEDGGVAALGIMPGRVRRFRPSGSHAADKVPHMGWNHVAMPVRHPLLSGLPAGGDYYFANSYYVEPAAGDNAAIVCGLSDHAGVAFAAMAGRGSVFAAQCHPEKSGEAGLDILARFLKWDGSPC